MGLYHQKRVAEGKLSKNIISNKVVPSVFAVVKQSTPSVDTAS